MAKARKQYHAVGSRYGSGPVSVEVHQAADRWREDVAVLAGYGFPQSSLDKFEGLVAEHDTLRAARPQAVSAKSTAVNDARQITQQTRQWLDKAFSNLRALAIDHDGIEADMAAIEQRSADGLDAEVAASVEAIKKHRDKMPEGVTADALIAEGEALVPQLQTLGSERSATADEAKTDTEELNVLEGRLLEIVAALNNAGRKAFRALGNQVKVSAYKYHAIAGKPSATSGGTPSEPAHPTPGA